MTEPSDRRRRDRGPTARAGNALFRLLRYMARSGRSAYGAIITYLSFSFFLLLGAVWVFAQLAQEVLQGTTQQFDEAVLTWVAGHRSELLDHVALEVTALGNFATLAVLIGIVSVFLWLTRHKISVALLMIAVAGGSILNNVLKEIFNRPRPTVVDAGTDVMTLSFPSGHAMSSFIAYACVAFLVGRLEPTRTMKVMTWSFAGLIILGVGASRIYLGVHYPSDVVAGFTAGLAWLAFVISGITAIRYLGRGEPEVERHEQDLEE
jgi:undecaprenyl-diphosphatase